MLILCFVHRSLIVLIFFYRPIVLSRTFFVLYRDGAVRTWVVDHQKQLVNSLADLAGTHRGQAVAFFRFAEGENVAIVTEDGMVSINQLDYQPPAATLGTSVKGTVTKPKRQRTKMLFSVQKEISCARVKASSTPMVCMCVCVCVCGLP
jgi:hypothetical protein